MTRTALDPRCPHADPHDADGCTATWVQWHPERTVNGCPTCGVGAFTKCATVRCGCLIAHDAPLAVAPFTYLDRAGVTRCVGCGHVADHPRPCGARRLLGDACTCTGLPLNAHADAGAEIQQLDPASAPQSVSA